MCLTIRGSSAVSVLDLEQSCVCWSNQPDASSRGRPTQDRCFSLSTMSKPPEGGTSERTTKDAMRVLDDPFPSNFRSTITSGTGLPSEPGDAAANAARAAFFRSALVDCTAIDGGGSRWTRTIDLTLIRRVL